MATMSSDSVYLACTYGHLMILRLSVRVTRICVAKTLIIDKYITNGFSARLSLL